MVEDLSVNLFGEHYESVGFYGGSNGELLKFLEKEVKMIY